MAEQDNPRLYNQVAPGLKDFQKRSVDYVFDRFYGNEDPTNRFLVADEVGLGKTMVARGIIARAIDHLWDKVERLDVVYICSNTDIARQNIRRLNITEEGFPLASRITMLPLKLQALNKNKVNFISFTPGTSFNLRSSTGIVKERQLLYNILKEAWRLGNTKGPINLFQCGASRDNWRSSLKNFKPHHLDGELKEKFMERLQQIPELREEFDDLAHRFRIYREHQKIPECDRRQRNDFIGKLRYELAVTCIHALKPDLIIMDEFQRFKYLLDDKNPIGELATELFNHHNVNEGVDTKILLLSATPYKMYTMHHEHETEEHYGDFLRTLEFLYDDEQELAGFAGSLKNYRDQLYRLHQPGSNGLLPVKEELQCRLKKVMIRTERLGVTADRNGMVQDCHQNYCRLDPEDISSFRFLDQLTSVLQTGDHLEFWKSAPYLLNFMEDYALKRKFEKMREESPSPLAELLNREKSSQVYNSNINKYEHLDPSNPRLRYLYENNLDQGWQLLWVPPALPYYQTQGVYASPEAASFTKALVFSSWRVVPKVIASLASYEAERRMITSFKSDTNYRNVHKEHVPLLRFSISEGRLTGMPALTLLYPSLTLSRRINIPELVAALGRGGLPPWEELFEQVKRRVELLLEEAVAAAGIEIDPTINPGGQADERWYYAALALMERHFYPDEIQDWIDAPSDYAFGQAVKITKEGEEDMFSAHVDRFFAFFQQPEKLGRRPEKLTDVLAKMALAAPAVVALRSLNQKLECAEASPQLLHAASRIAAGFRRLYNQPDSIALLRSLYKNQPYWEQALSYGMDGNLQAVMDEYVHILYEALGLMSQNPSIAVEQLRDEIYQALTIRTTTAEFEEIKPNSSQEDIEVHKGKLRCRYAMRFQEGKSEGDEEVTREDQVRRAFNSPFRPFILATTSIGQEGLDFHQYCRSIYHWNLPSNPVDLEQREGRIHRYKGHVIRQNIARHYGLPSIDLNGKVKDPWEAIFQKALAERGPAENDLKPFWIFETQEGYKIERHAPIMPFSRDSGRINNLKKSLTLYRLVLGQPRQEELLEYLKNLVKEEDLSEEILNYRIDLSP